MRTLSRALVALLAAALSLLAPVSATPAHPPTARAAISTSYLSQARQPVAPSVFHDWGTMATTTAGRQAVQFLEVDPNDPQVTFEASLAKDHIVGLERTSSQAARDSYEGHHVVAAINGDVWSGYTYPSYDAPNGTHIQNGELMTSAPGTHPTFGIDASDHVMIGNPLVSTTIVLPDGTSQIVNRINQHRRAAEVVLYTPRFGSTTPVESTGIEAVIAGFALPLTSTGTYQGTVAEVRPADGGQPIDPDKVVLQGSVSSWIASLQPGQPIQMSITITPGWEGVRHAVSGRETIVRDGAEYIQPRPTSADQIHPRTALGITAAGTIILATVDGRESGTSLGVTLPELAELMISKGAVQAINMDGGGSTTMVVRQPGDAFASVVNRPSDGFERGVADSLQVISTAPTGPPALITMDPGSKTVFAKTTIDYRVIVQDAAYNPVPLTSSQLSWSVLGAAGTVDPSGHFVATSPGTATVVATAASSGIQGQAQVNVIADTFPPQATPPRPTLVKGRLLDPITVPVTFTWSATDQGLGVARYELQQSTDNAVWAGVALPSPLARLANLNLARGHIYRLRVRAIDKAGNAGTWMPGQPFKLNVFQERTSLLSIVKGSWGIITSASYDRSHARSTRSGGAVSQFTFVGHAFAWVAAMGPSRGSARVYLDGSFVGAVSTYRSAGLARVMVFARSWSYYGRHVVTIRALGTTRHPRVDLDAFVVLQPSPVVPIPEPGSTKPPPPPAPPSPSPSPTPSPTPPPVPPAQGNVLVGAGDIASCGLTSDTATGKLVAGIGGTVFTAGDNAYENGTPAEYANCYDPAWGGLKSRTEPTVGNHDYGTSGAAGYFGYFGAAAGTAGQGWYAYDIGAWRIYALNSNCSSIGGCGAGSPEEAWLRSDLAANPRQCVAAIWHHPRFSSGYHGNATVMSDIWKTLNEFGADVVINGHDHDYERFAPQTPSGSRDDAGGIREFVVGTGGATLRAFSSVQANSQVRNSTTFGVLKLSLAPTSYSWQFVPIAGQTFTDSGTTSCH